MIQAVRRRSPRHVTLEDLTDSSLLGTGEHGAAIVVDPPDVGQWPRNGGAISHNEGARPDPQIRRSRGRGGRSPRVGSTRSRGWGSRQPTSRRSGSRQGRAVASARQHPQLFQVRAVPELGDAIATPR
jgi:hypothetical protein